MIHSDVKAAGKKHVALSPGRWRGITCMKTSTEYTTINSNRPKASSRFCCFPLPIRDSYSKLAAKNYSPIIFLFLLAIWFQMVKDHLLCSHTCQEITTLLILHIMSIINQIHYILWSVLIMYWISLLSRCNVGKKITSLKITEKNAIKSHFLFQQRKRSSFCHPCASDSIINKLKMLLAFANWLKKEGGIFFHKIKKSPCPAYEHYT